jgi:hypothetical protein
LVATVDPQAKTLKVNSKNSVPSKNKREGEGTEGRKRKSARRYVSYQKELEK